MVESGKGPQKWIISEYCRRIGQRVAESCEGGGGGGIGPVCVNR